MKKFRNLLKNPAFFDIFGLITFSFISLATLDYLNTEKPFSKPFLTILLFIGIAGLIVDGHIVWENFIKRLFKKPLNRQ